MLSCQTNRHEDLLCLSRLSLEICWHRDGSQGQRNISLCHCERWLYVTSKKLCHVESRRFCGICKSHFYHFLNKKSRNFSSSLFSLSRVWLLIQYVIRHTAKSSFLVLTYFRFFVYRREVFCWHCFMFAFSYAKSDVWLWTSVLRRTAKQRHGSRHWTRQSVCDLSYGVGIIGVETNIIRLKLSRQTPLNPWLHHVIVNNSRKGPSAN